MVNLLSVTFQEFNSVVQKMYKDGDSMTKQLITEFLNLGFKEMVTNHSITDLVRLNGWSFFIFPVIDSLSELDVIKFRELIPEIKWKDLSLNNLCKFVNEVGEIAQKWSTTRRQRDFTGFLFKVRIMESVMNWALEHPNQMTEIFELINKSVCLCDFPDEYLNFVIKPHLLMSFLEESICFDCSRHKCRIVLEKSTPIATEEKKIVDCYIIEMSSKMRLMTRDVLTFTAGKRNVIYGKFSLEFQPNSKSLFCLSFTSIDWKTKAFPNTKLILVDKKTYMKKYPVMNICNMQLNQLREIVANYQNLSVMFFVNSASGYYPLE